MTELSTNWLEDESVTAAKLASAVAGTGLSGGAGSPLSVDYGTSGTTACVGDDSRLSDARPPTAHGSDHTDGTDNLSVDDLTIAISGSQLIVKSSGITATQMDLTDDYSWTGGHDFTGGTIAVATPTLDSQACTKAYADALKAGMKIKDVSRALRDTNIAITGDPGTVDGVGSWSTGQRILLTNQSTGTQNGIWEVNTAGAWTRPTDFATGDGASGAMTWIDQGTSYGESQWGCTTDEPNDIIDTDVLAFVQISGAGQITAGTGLQKSGNTINVGDGSTGNINGINRTSDDISAAVDDVTLAIVSNLIEIKDNGVGVDQIATAIAGVGLQGGGGSALAFDINGITPETTADDADMVPIYDSTAVATRKMTRANFLTGITRDADWDANTILAADSDDAPAALTVNASTIVGRKAAGGIAAMSPSEVKVILGYLEDLVDDTTPQLGGNLDLNEKMIQWNPIPTSDHTANGYYINDQVDENAFGLMCALHVDSDGNWIEAHADSAATMPCKGLALETGTGVKNILLRGFVRDDTWAWATVGSEVYVSDTTSGGLVDAASIPASTGDQVQRVGIVMSADVIYFDPDNTVIEIV